MLSRSRHPQSVSPINQPRKRVQRVEMGKNVCKKVEMGEHPKMQDPRCIKTYYQTTMMPKIPQSISFSHGQTPK